MRRLIIGLTGQTGAGKTTATDFFKEQGFSLINCDELVHSLGDKNEEYINAIKKVFGEAVITFNNRVDRKALGQIVFSSREKLDLLNRVAFPIIRKAMQTEVQALFDKGHSVVILDAPTLFESETDKMCDMIISVTADSEALLKRIMKRDNISREMAEKRLSSQHTKEFFTANSDYVVDNSSTKEDFISRLGEICKTIKERSNED